MELKAATRLTASTGMEEVEVTFKVSGEAATLVPKLLTILSYLGSAGASRTITIEDVPAGTIKDTRIEEGDVKIGFDGDGSDKLTDIRVNGKPFVYK
jgi:hypothetical protein